LKKGVCSFRQKNFLITDKINEERNALLAEKSMLLQVAGQREEELCGIREGGGAAPGNYQGGHGRRSFSGKK